MHVPATRTLERRLPTAVGRSSCFEGLARARDKLIENLIRHAPSATLRKAKKLQQIARSIRRRLSEATLHQVVNCNGRPPPDGQMCVYVGLNPAKGNARWGNRDGLVNSSLSGQLLDESHVRAVDAHWCALIFDREKCRRVRQSFSRAVTLACHCTPRACHASNYLVVVHASAMELALLQRAEIMRRKHASVIQQQ